MNIAILVYANETVGLGHWYRANALADKMTELGHTVVILGNMQTRKHIYFQVRENNELDLIYAIEQVEPDYLIVDLQDSVPDYIYGLGVRIVVLNGVGREDEDRAELTFIQGFSNKKRNGLFAGPEYVILRDSIFAVEYSPQSDWFVWGGAKDKMRLLEKFYKNVKSGTGFAFTTGFSDYIFPHENNQPQLVIGNPRDDKQMILSMSIAKKACVAMGMVAWELVAMGVPAYVFSWSKGHLKFAKEMEKAGLIKAYPKIGIPDDDEFIRFINEPFKITGERPDALGATRIAQILKENL